VPTLPANGWGGNGWTFWQYTSSGSVPGIVGRVDLDHFNGTNLSPALIP
jgi:lysozyme